MNVTAIFGTPRSGTTWLGQLYNSSPQIAYRFQPLFSHAFKGRISEYSSKADIEKFYADIIITEDEFVLQKKNISNRDNIVFTKEIITHLVWKEVRYHYVIENLLKNSDTKIVGLMRHPCSVIWSWLNAPKEFKHEWDISKEWKLAPSKNMGRPEEYNGYEKWKEIAFNFMRYAETYSQQFCIVKYEDLNLHTEAVIKHLYAFSDIDWNKQTAEFIVQSKNNDDNDPYGFFKKDKANNEWKNKLPAVIEQVILNDPDFATLNAYFKWSI